jgi:hypothetical protein
MVDDTTADRGGGFREAVRQLSASKATIPHAEFHRLLSLENREMPMDEWHKVVQFASEQCALWQVRWLYSAAAAPDLNAGDEWERWQQAYAAYLEPLVERIPNVQEPLEREHGLRAAQCALGRRFDGTKGRPLSRSWSAVLSAASILLRRAGMSSVAGRLYAASLYPKGTVGRAGS